MTSPFPAAGSLEIHEPAGLAYFPPGARLRPRLLRDFLLIALVSGSATLTLDDRRLALGPGSCVLARPGMTDSYAWDAERSTRHYWVHFGVSGRPPSSTWPLVRHWPEALAIPSAFRHLVWLCGDLDDPGRAELARAYLSVLVGTFVTGTTDGAQAVHTPSALEAAIRHVRRRWDAVGFTPMARTELADAAGVSVAHLARLFVAEFGVGPARGLESVRLLRALPLLARSGLTIRRIADLCGFADPYHFSHRFTAVFGTSPSGYRISSGPDRADRRLPEGVMRLEHVLLSIQ